MPTWPPTVGFWPTRWTILRWGWVLLGSALLVGGLAARIVADFHTRWFAHAADLLQQRAARVLHLCAAAWGAGIALSLLLRGLVVRYQFGWESTFLDAAQVHAIADKGPAHAVSRRGEVLLRLRRRQKGRDCLARKSVLRFRLPHECLKAAILLHDASLHQPPAAPSRLLRHAARSRVRRDDRLEQRVTAVEPGKADRTEVQAVWDQMAAAYQEGVQNA